MSYRSGLSRVEVLVGLLLLVVASGLLLASIGRIRVSAARASCQNNQKQIGLAILCYIDSKAGPLPPLADQGEHTPTGRSLSSVFAIITPYLESHPWNYNPERTSQEYHSHSSVEFAYHQKDGTPGTLYGGVANQVRRVFIDPADITAQRLQDVPMTLPDGTTGYYTAGSYAANGLLPWSTGGLADLKRGPANTIMLADRPQVCQNLAGDTIYNLWGVGFYSPHMPTFATLTPTDPPGLWSTNQLAPVGPLPGEDEPDRDTRIQFRVGWRDAAPQSLNSLTPIQLLGKGQPCDPRLPGSPHKDGLPVLMADGSVRLFGKDTSPWVFWNACFPTRGTPEEE